MNSRGCARDERTPGNGGFNACHPGGVVPSLRAVDGLVPGEPRRGSGALRWRSGGVARASLHPRLFTVNPAGVRPGMPATGGLIHESNGCGGATELLGRETAFVVQKTRASAKIDTRLIRNNSVEPMQMDHRDAMNTEKTKQSRVGHSSLNGD